jgi:hypothetical protein
MEAFAAFKQQLSALIKINPSFLDHEGLVKQLEEHAFTLFLSLDSRLHEGDGKLHDLHAKLHDVHEELNTKNKRVRVRATFLNNVASYAECEC